jgi:hypothetical protein
MRAALTAKRQGATMMARIRPGVPRRLNFMA